MQIFVNSVSGNNTVSLNVESSDSIEQLKALVLEKTHAADVEEMRLVFAGKELEDHREVADYRIQSESTLDLLMRLRGGRGSLPRIDPNLLVLAQRNNQKKMICRKCYARLDIRAKNCRKKKCGHSNQLRSKATLNGKQAKKLNCLETRVMILDEAECAIYMARRFHSHHENGMNMVMR
ncbi:Ubiquitin-60S ribosomal protein L40 [Heracleum sosnowskyi]|uniref:Ubiquitin-60S ribosomal protein L40 n=1 Tax=Heracleum sosnowskyi TaxID=360622 RepID=A0AAD8IKA3_9APIA|nr:Ubiquitin-60S ribosomal protein L40 [Heracleum sosnowskyi]